MKQYQFTLNVPDDFNPEELELNLAYKDNVEVVGEGFIDVTKLIDSIEPSNVYKLSSDEKTVIIFKFKNNDYDIQDFRMYLNIIKSRVEEELNCYCIFMLDDIDFMVSNPSESIDMLNKMISKIQILKK